ncbi:hypothetical protein Nepgr_026436 [Nepenthes gracilis]|uniref:Uncharacterized protein n=1 Tax=Nepenthes gracilis TaxID=150966 RepID=A0AAD3T844_NEPGR|nr:hypothetical protein Nepgr_026436 [Nepenthes gracilis]
MAKEKTCKANFQRGNPDGETKGGKEEEDAEAFEASLPVNVLTRQKAAKAHGNLSARLPIKALAGKGGNIASQHIDRTRQKMRVRTADDQGAKWVHSSVGV